MSAVSTWARRFATGLSSLRDRAAARLAALRFNPSRVGWWFVDSLIIDYVLVALLVAVTVISVWTHR
jgi:hypothetical protein